MKASELARLRALLHTYDVPSHAQVLIINGMLASPTDASARWAHLIEPPKRIVRTLRNTRPKWRPSRAPTYAAYLALLERTLVELQRDARTHPTPEDAAKEARTLNAAREAAGKRPMGTKDGVWTTWIPAHLREATVRAFEDLYLTPEERAQPLGRRVRPFTTIPQREGIRRKWQGLLQQLQPHIDAGFEEQTPLQQQRYRAASSAKREIMRSMSVNTPDVAVPIHWTHVLDADTRARLREAEREAML